jgi:probable phosphoglycerate mutase
MEIYLVRHGQTGGNVAHRHQAEDTPLTALGHEQARNVGQILKEYKPTHLLTSNLVRALETAQEIGKACDLVPDTSRHFVELARPRGVTGYLHRSLSSYIFYVQWLFGKEDETDEGWESYRDVRDRILLAKEELAKYPEDARLVVVSHSVFISLFVAHLCDDNALSPIEAVRVFRRLLAMPNTHVTPLLLDTKLSVNTCAWTLNS